MKKQILYVLLAGLMFASVPQSASAMIIGFAVPGAGIGLAFGGGAFAMVGAAELKANKNTHNGFILLAIGTILGEKVNDVRAINDSDLQDKVALGIYTVDEANLIKSDLARLQEQPQSVVKFEQYSQKQQLIQEIMNRTGVSELTAGYIAASFGIQAE